MSESDYPLEVLSLNFETIEWTYDHQGRADGAGKPKKGAYNPRRCDPNKGECP
jgi:hypothetical protein